MMVRILTSKSRKYVACDVFILLPHIQALFMTSRTQTAARKTADITVVHSILNDEY